jgi:hypothetical protein
MMGEAAASKTSLFGSIASLDGPFSEDHASDVAAHFSGRGRPMWPFMADIVGH